MHVSYWILNNLVLNDEMVYAMLWIVINEAVVVIYKLRFKIFEIMTKASYLFNRHRLLKVTETSTYKHVFRIKTCNSNHHFWEE